MALLFEAVSLASEERAGRHGVLGGSGLLLKHLTSNLLNAVKGVDGSYVIHLTTRFSALVTSFLVLIECMHEQRKVER